MVKHTRTQGISLVEVIVATSIALVAVIALMSAYALYLHAATSTTSAIQADLLAEEGVEALRTYRDGGWDASFGSLAPGTVYYLSYSTSTSRWSATTVPLYIDDVFLRFFMVEDVNRDVVHDITTVGTNDPDTKKITVTVSWWNGKATSTKVLAIYLHNI